MILSFELPWATPSNNQLLRMHWSVRRRMLTEMRVAVLALILRSATEWPRPPGRKVAVTITRVSPRQLDRDNLYGGAKVLLDAMTQLGLIRDDSEQWVKVNIGQRRGDACTKVRLRLL